MDLRASPSTERTQRCLIPILEIGSYEAIKLARIIKCCDLVMPVLMFKLLSTINCR